MSIPRIILAVNEIDDDLVSAALEYKPKKKAFAKVLKWAAVAAVICLFAGVAALAIGKFSGNSPSGVYVSSDTSAEQTTTQTTPPKTNAETVTEETKTSATVPNSANMAPDENTAAETAPGETTVYDPPFIKTPGPDMSPQAQLAKVKESLAIDKAESIRINQEYATLKASRAELLSVVGNDEEKLSSAQNDELFEIDVALQDLYLNYSYYIKHPDCYEEDVYIEKLISDCIEGSKEYLIYDTEGTVTYYISLLSIDMCDELDKIYKNGADFDTVMLYYFTRLNEIDQEALELSREYRKEHNIEPNRP